MCKGYDVQTGGSIGVNTIKTFILQLLRHLRCWQKCCVRVLLVRISSSAPERTPQADAYYATIPWRSRTLSTKWIVVCGSNCSAYSKRMKKRQFINLPQVTTQYSSSICRCSVFLLSCCCFIFVNERISRLWVDEITLIHFTVTFLMSRPIISWNFGPRRKLCTLDDRKRLFEFLPNQLFSIFTWCTLTS